MTTDSQATAPVDQAPPAEADTAAPTGDTAQNTPASPPVDWQKRYQALQATYTQKAQELAALRNAAGADEDEDEETEEPVQPRKRGRNLQAELDAAKARADAAEAAIAESVYGPAVIADYGFAVELLNAAETTADYVAAFEAYHQRRSAGMTPSQTATAPSTPAAPTREQAVLPRVDSNRSDLLPDEVALEEAKRKRDGPGFVGTLLRAAGVE